jgi:hypothetical protein
MNDNRISANLTAEVRDRILSEINAIKAQLPFLIDISKDERSSLPKMGDKSRAFVLRALEVATQKDSFLPRSFDVGEMRKDVEMTNNLAAISTALAALTELVEDTYILAGSEAYSAALVVYQSAKANGQGEALDDALDSLAQRFARKSSSTTENPPLPK